MSVDDAGRLSGVTRKRRNFSDAIIKLRLEHAGYQCEGTLEDGTRCLAPARPGRFQADHDIPDQMGGKPTFDNCRILCTPCHAEKTRIDQGNIARSKRQESDHFGISKAIAPDRPMRGPPMPTTARAAARAKRGSRPPVARSPNYFGSFRICDTAESE